MLWLYALDALNNQGYSVGAGANPGTLGQIIPPSVVLVVLADQLGVSVGDLFVGSLVV